MIKYQLNHICTSTEWKIWTIMIKTQYNIYKNILTVAVSIFLQGGTKTVSVVNNPVPFLLLAISYGIITRLISLLVNKSKTNSFASQTWSSPILPQSRTKR